MPAQQCLPTDHVQGVSSSAIESSQGEQEQTVVAVKPSPSDAATWQRHLLTEYDILGQEFRPRTGKLNC